MTLATKELPDGDIMEAIHHEAKYNEQAKALDQSAQMGKHLLGLVHFGRSINFPYDQLIQHKDYKQGFIILARLRRSGVIIGKICGVIKNINLFGKQQKAVYIFDLRVPTTIQKKGVGSFLLQTAQNISKSRGVTVQLMSINRNNVKIENLSNKFGWQNGCARKIMTTTYDHTAPLITNKQEQQGFKLQFFQPKQVKVESQRRDLSLVNFKELSQCKNYLGELRASTQQSEARLHLYKGDKQFGMVCKRFFFEPQTFNYLHTWIFLIFLFLSGPFYLVFTSINLKFQVLNATRLGLGVIGIILFSLLLFGLKYAINMLNSPFIRVFGYSFKGNSEQQQLLCEQVFQMSRRYAATTKASIRLNEDPRAQYLPFLKGLFKAFGTTIFKYKFINQAKVQRYYDENNFFDPRDL